MTITDTLEVKQRWLRSEWSERCQFSRYVRQYSSKREELSPGRKEEEIVERVKVAFHEVRGKWALWQEPMETAKWIKVETDLSLKTKGFSLETEAFFGWRWRESNSRP